MTPLAITFIINLATQAIKKYVMPRYGSFGVHVVLFVFSMLAAVYLSYGDQFPGIKDFLITAAQFFCAGIALYEVMLSRFAKLLEEKV